MSGARSGRWLEKGATMLCASRYDQRFSYCAYVPKSYDEVRPGKHALVVLVHGTDRAAQRYRDEWIDFAERHGAFVLAPLFPAGIIEENELNAYKFVKYHDIRFDLVLLAMVEELAGKYGVEFGRFALFGFSGGAQFVHRFYYLHPERLSAVSIASPGNVTLLDDSLDWFVGTRDFRKQFGSPIEQDKLRDIPVQLVVGALDCETLPKGDESPFWQEGVDYAGDSRIARIRSLKRSMEKHGIRVRLDEIPGVKHEGVKLFPAVKFFLEGLGGN
ncbi:hypothetical protein [Cohnella algarum]|uniref:hypothetical protein n=1 Tax=Cohnella algarum TaxID=2044859 RepID=UPI001966D13F|nr:hypothetical protein [Cohnella algarum]MBN2984417.1 hypothetical protein [Cohnella algarum]